MCSFPLPEFTIIWGAILLFPGHRFNLRPADRKQKPRTNPPDTSLGHLLGTKESYFRHFRFDTRIDVVCGSTPDEKTYC